jgi:N-acetylmuramoyl-L-alanine amidase
MPTIKWIGSPNFHQGRAGHKVLAIVNHIMCGTLDGTDTWFKNPASQVSAHYGIGKDGSIHQYVKDEDTAWAVGIVKNPSSPLIGQNPGVNPNYYTISIEHEGYPQDGITEAQYQSTLWLHKQLIAKFNIPVDETHITGHFAFDSVSRTDCPGPKFPWGRLFADLKKGVITMLTKGSEGDAVKALQTKLKAVLKLGDDFAIDGFYGDQTVTAVKSFQQQYHLAFDGIAGPQTLAALDKAFAAVTQSKPAPAPTPAPAQPSKPAPAPTAPAQAPAPTLAEAQKAIFDAIDTVKAEKQKTANDVQAVVNGLQQFANDLINKLREVQ